MGGLAGLVLAAALARRLQARTSVLTRHSIISRLQLVHGRYGINIAATKNNL